MKRLVSQFFRPAAVLLLMFLVAACGADRSPDSSPEDPDPPDGSPVDELPSGLEPDGTFIDDSGGVISALPGALEEGVNVSMSLTSAPPEALPELAHAVGPYYLVQAETDTSAEDMPFFLALPVPPEADPEKLALAFRAEAADMEGADPAGPPVWEFLPSIYDPDGQYLGAVIWELAESGRIIVLVESDEVEPPLVSEPPAGTEDRLGSQATGDPSFNVSCSKFNDPAKNHDGYRCGKAEEDRLAAALEKAYGVYTALGFNEPRLTSILSPDSWFSFRIGFSMEKGLEFSRVYPAKLHPYWDADPGDNLMPCGRADDRIIRGVYNSATASLIVCMDDRGMDANARITALHEYFHATQFAYKGVRNSRNYDDGSSWVLEATATAASASTDGMARLASRPARAVDVPLDSNEGFAEYEAQDFFVFAGRRLGRDLDFLIDIFNRGEHTNHVHNGLKKLGVSGGLPQLYWEWVTNQAFEARVDNGNRAAQPECSFWKEAATPVERTYDQGKEGIDDLRITPLTSRVVSITFEPLPAETYTAMVSISGKPSESLRSKFYEESWRGSTICHTHPEARSHTVTVEPGEARTVHLLLSNTDRNDSAAPIVSIGQQLTILSPEPGAEYEEADTIEFQASATSAAGGSPDRFDITWAHKGTILMSSGSGETIERTFCDGIYTFTATARHRDTGERLIASTSFTVIDSDPPPEWCAPDIKVTSPVAGATYPVGESVTFSARFEDDHPETPEPVHPLVWRLGGPGGPVLHEGSATFTTSALPAGNHVVFVEYGTASDSVTLRVVDTPGTPPVTTIRWPNDGDWFWFSEWEPLDELYSDIEVVGTARGTDGVISGENLEWFVRRGSEGDWELEATGESFILRMHYGNEPVTNYFIMLRATDSEGLTGEDQIQITYQRPPN